MVFGISIEKIEFIFFLYSLVFCCIYIMTRNIHAFYEKKMKRIDFLEKRVFKRGILNLLHGTFLKFDDKEGDEILF